MRAPILPEKRKRLQLVQALTEERKRQRISQKALASRMHTKQTNVHLIEVGEYDSRISTLERYAASLGKRIVYQLVDLPEKGRE